MTLIKLNDGESIVVQMNFDKNEKPYSITIMRRGDALMMREFNLENKKNLPTLTNNAENTKSELNIRQQNDRKIDLGDTSLNSSVGSAFISADSIQNEINKDYEEQ